MEEMLRQAERLEKEYDWLGAAESYKKALTLLSEDDFSRKCDVAERLGYAFYRFAFQAETNEEFTDRLRQSTTAYEKVAESYKKLQESLRTSRASRCNAMIDYIDYWLAPDAKGKKNLIDECWRLTKEALKAFEEAGENLEYGRTYNQLSLSAILGFALDWDQKAREKIMNEAVENGSKAIKLLSASEEPLDLARAYVNTASFLELSGYYFHDLDGREKHFQKARDYWQKANEFSEEAAMIELLSGLGAPSLDWPMGSPKALRNLDKAYEYSKKTKDKFLIGSALEKLTIHTNWSTDFPDDPDGIREMREKTLRYAEEAKNQFSLISFISPFGDILWVEAPRAEYYSFLAVNETNLSKRRELLEKALDAEPNLRRRAEDSGCPQNIMYAHHVASKILAFLANMEKNSEEKNALLEKALSHRNESIRLTKLFLPFDYWDQGIMQAYLAGIKSELADVAEDPETKRDILQEAALDIESAIKLSVKDVAFFEREGPVSLSANIGMMQYRHGSFLNRLYELTKNKEYLEKAIKSFEDAEESFHKLNMTNHMAECYWKAATGLDDLGEHLKAAENFRLASNNYANAAERIPQLKDFYQDHALYMQAWNEIENARHHHARQEYDLAEEHFEKAADLHKRMKKWSYLTSNYSAWASVENAEDLSRREQCEDAIQAFEQALKLFDETKRSIRNELDKVEDPDEKRMANSMIRATDMRHEYCVARISLEEAKILDKKGDHYFSSEKYRSAAQAFEKISQALENDQEQKEFNLIISLARAWQKMTQAEAEASPTLYAEASQLFERAKEYCPNEQAKMLVLGHSRFCKALEEGTKFADTRDATMHTTATKYLQSAASYYVKAGFPKASEYAEATELLLDAYAHMDNAKEEKDPGKKAKLYKMAETVLQTSAGSFMRAEHPEKREQVLGLLEKAKKEKELALSLAEVLHAPSVISTTTSFATPVPTSEEAVGSERFEHADIQASLIIRQKELKVGEPLNLEIELVNAGKAPALLIKVTEVIPEGFEIVERPETCRVEDSYIDMKGRRLDTLKTGELKFVLKPKVQGTFALKPTVLYLDENGKYKSHELEAVTVIVKELGIKGWLKGER